MLLQVYNKAHVKIGAVECIGLKIESDLSKFDKTLSFSININNADLLELEGYLRTKHDEFVIKEKNYSDGYYDIVAVLNLEELEGKAFEDFDSTEQTIEKCINTALAGTDWIVNKCTVTKKRTVRATFISALDIIKQALKTYLCEVQFDTVNKKINIYEKIGNDKGEYLMDTVNAKKIDTQEDTYDYFTKLIAVGATNDDGTPLTCTVNNNSYSDKEKTCYWKDERYTVLENLQADAQIKLASMAQPHVAYSVEVAKMDNVSIGDTITLISKDTKTRLKTRIVKLTEYPDEPCNNTCEVNSSIYSFEDIQQQQKDVNSTVDNITSDNGTISERALSDSVIDKIFARSVVAQKITAIEADIGTLNATKANITELNAVTARVGSLEANSATINDLQAATARIGVLEAGYGQIQVLQTDIASINTLLAGNVSAGSTQTIVLNANNTTIANALIKSAMIESINADKINAGNINTDNVTIKSSSGGIQIADNTMQFKDKNNKVRIQIGQDTSNNFNFIVRAEDGATTLIDGTGVKENAIADNLIKTRMLQDNSVKGSKIDWDDFFTTINADGTHTLNSSKVKLNSNNQTLDVAFNQLNSAVTEGGENLVPNGNFIMGDTSPKNWWYWGNCSNYINQYDGYVWIENKSGDSGGLSTNIKLQRNTVYTLSLFFIREGNVKDAYFLLEYNKNGASVGKQRIDLISDSKRHSYTFTTLDVDFDNIVGLTLTHTGTTDVTAGYVVKLGYVKIEKGEMATAFSVAPIDINNKIQTNTTAISVQQGKIEQIVSELTQTTDKTNGLVTLISNYNTVVDTVNSHTQTIGSQESVSGDGSLFGSVKSINSSISQLSDSISLKVNKSTYDTDLQGIRTDIKNNSSAISLMNDKIALKVEKTDITNAINNLNIGGENLITNGNFEGDLTSPKGWWFWGNCSNYPQSYKGWIWIQNNSTTNIGGLSTSVSLKSNTTYTLSLACAKQGSVKSAYFKLEYSKNGVNIGQNKIINLTWDSKRHSYTFTTPSASFDYCGCGLVHEGTTDSSGGYILQLNLVKLEEGNKATAFSVSPNDLKNYTNTKVSSVEQEITANAITTKISTAINDGTSSINTTYFTQDNTGLTIKNGGIKVLNNANTQIFGVSTDGYLDMQGAITQYNSNGKKSIEIKNNAIKIYNYKASSDDLVGGFANVNDFTNTSSDSGIALYGTQNHALSIGMKRDNSITKYITCVDNGDGSADRRIDVSMETYIKDGWGITLCNKDFGIRGFIKADTGGQTGLCLIGNDAVHIGCGKTNSNYAPIMDITKDGVTIFGNLTVVGTINGKTI